jgi:nitroreductase
MLNRMIRTDSLISAAQSAAHAFDHYWIRGAAVPASLLTTMEVLLKEIARRKIRLNAPLLWALQMYSIAKMGLQENYLDSTGADTSHEAEEATLDMRAAKNELVTCIKGRRSVRRWDDKDVSLEEVQRLIDVAKWAPSSCNLQPWKIMLLTSHEDKTFLTQYYRSAHNRFWSSAPVVLVLLANLGVYPDPMTPYVQLDSGAFIQNLLLLFHAHGLSACWVGFTAWDNYGNCRIGDSERDEFYARFGIPREYVPMSLIPVGHSAVLPRPPARKSLDEIMISGANMPNADQSRACGAGTRIGV